MLELTLALPLLLCVTALMVNAGVVSTWKVRGLVASRHAAWSSRSPRQPDAFPVPIGATHIDRIERNVYDLMENLDTAALHQPVARGPLPMGNRVNSDLLNCNREAVSAQALVERQFPLLTSMGPYRLEAHTTLLSGRWQHGEMGMVRTGERRIPVIYQLTEAPEELLQAFLRVVRAVLDPRLQWALRALDHDDEFIGYQQRLAGSPIMVWADSPPDLHPTLGLICTHDPTRVRQRVDELIKQIKDVPKTLTLTFRTLYERVIQELEWRIAHDSSLSAAEIRAMIEEIQQCRAKIQILKSL
jgi:hypothetical protein